MDITNGLTNSEKRFDRNLANMSVDHTLISNLKSFESKVSQFCLSFYVVSHKNVWLYIKLICGRAYRSDPICRVVLQVRVFRSANQKYPSICSETPRRVVDQNIAHLLILCIFVFRNSTVRGVTALVRIVFRTVTVAQQNNTTNRKPSFPYICLDSQVRHVIRMKELCHSVR